MLHFTLFCSGGKDRWLFAGDDDDHPSLTKLLLDRKGAKNASNSVVLMRDWRKAEDDDKRGSLVVHEKLVERSFIHVHAFLDVLDNALDLV